jgi:hypothetical protein
VRALFPLSLLRHRGFTAATSIAVLAFPLLPATSGRRTVQAPRTDPRTRSARPHTTITRTSAAECQSGVNGAHRADTGRYVQRYA